MNTTMTLLTVGYVSFMICFLLWLIIMFVFGNNGADKLYHRIFYGEHYYVGKLNAPTQFIIAATIVYGAMWVFKIVGDFLI